jgi:hypothetical protein
LSQLSSKKKNVFSASPPHFECCKQWGKVSIAVVNMVSTVRYPYGVLGREMK